MTLTEAYYQAEISPKTIMHYIIDANIGFQYHSGKRPMNIYDVYILLPFITSPTAQNYFKHKRKFTPNSLEAAKLESPLLFLNFEKRFLWSIPFTKAGLQYGVMTKKIQINQELEISTLTKTPGQAYIKNIGILLSQYDTSYYYTSLGVTPNEI